MGNSATVFTQWPGPNTEFSSNDTYMRLTQNIVTPGAARENTFTQSLLGKTISHDLPVSPHQFNSYQASSISLSLPPRLSPPAPPPCMHTYIPKKMQIIERKDYLWQALYIVKVITLSKNKTRNFSTWKILVLYVNKHITITKYQSLVPPPIDKKFHESVQLWPVVIKD